MSRNKKIIYILITLTAGFISFVNARTKALSKLDRTDTTLQSWLVNEPHSITESEAEFNDRISELMSNLKVLQSELLTVLEDPLTSNETILEHVDSINKAHEYAIRQIGEHIVKLRHELGQINREKLMQFCVEALSGQISRLGGRMNGQGGRGYRYGQQNRGQRGYGFRGGAEQGTAGYGQRFRFWDRLANRLRLTSEQITVLQEKDPNFESESIDLYENLMAERQKLLSAFENPQSSDSELLQQIDSFISTHSRIERRIAEHVLLLRPYLTVEQQQWLIGLCRRFQD